MPFNHYAKIKRILNSMEKEWYIHRVNKPTSAKTFKGETRYFDHYYRIYDAQGNPIPYCKFQQIDLFAQVMSIDPADIVILED